MGTSPAKPFIAGAPMTKTSTPIDPTAVVSKPMAIKKARRLREQINWSIWRWYWRRRNIDRCSAIALQNQTARHFFEVGQPGFQQPQLLRGKCAIGEIAGDFILKIAQKIMLIAILNDLGGVKGNDASQFPDAALGNEAAPDVRHAKGAKAG